MKRFFLTLIIVLLFGVNSFSQNNSKSVIKWMSFKEAIELNSKSLKKKIIVDAYTSWCFWCKKMDETTFSHPEIAKYINEHFWAVKLNAESKDTIEINGTKYINPNPNANRSTHQLAAALLQNQMSYPSYAFLDETNTGITVIPGYYSPKDYEVVLHFIAYNAYKTTTFEKFKNSFKGVIIN